MNSFSLRDFSHYARLSELSRRVLNAAEQVAVALNHPRIGMGHVLLALLVERRSPMCALLHECGLNEDRLRHDLLRGDAVLLIGMDGVLVGALGYAEHFGRHGIGTDHLLLAMTANEHGEGLLREYDADPDWVRARLEAYLRRQ
ncbi:MAG: hypothetical protein H7175_00020 [Burkholderiales bacterium]|nr:hypothetical protein [Anaerolineae bacterium]